MPKTSKFVENENRKQNELKRNQIRSINKQSIVRKVNLTSYQSSKAMITRSLKRWLSCMTPENLMRWWVASRGSWVCFQSYRKMLPTMWSFRKSAQGFSGPAETGEVSQLRSLENMIKQFCADLKASHQPIQEENNRIYYHRSRKDSPLRWPTNFRIDRKLKRPTGTWLISKLTINPKRSRKRSVLPIMSRSFCQVTGSMFTALSKLFFGNL